MNEYFPTVVQVIPLDNFHVQVFFDDGKIVDYDATEDLKAEIFKPLRDIDAFKEACTVMNGTLAWDLSGNRDESSLENEEYPGEDVVEIINLPGETTTVYKLVDGRYMDRTNTVYIYDGKDTWTDTNGVEWNQEVI